MPFVTTFVVLAIAGIVDAGYLTYQHYKKKPIVCPLDHDCTHVTESRWAIIFGVRNEVLGVVYYAANLLGILGAVYFSGLTSNLYFLLLVFNSIGFFFSLFLGGVQLFSIKDYCFYCVISAGLSFLLFLNSIYLFTVL